jgi:deoxycytidine triphosphate deaminase
MLTESKIERLVADGAITISYYFDPLGKPPEHLGVQQVDPEVRESKATQAFRSALFGDRLGLTLGPLVLSHTKGRAKGRSRYRDFSGVFDMRESGGGISLRPGESVTVNTIERIALDGTLGALILPRLTHATAGLTLTPSYIDPLWDGLPVLHLVNVSRHAYKLQFGERIAACQFYRLEGEALPEGFRDRFIEKSHHYGLSWDRICSSDADPFPLRKRPTARIAAAERLTAAIGSGWTKLAAAGLTIGALMVALVAYGHFEGQVERIGELSQQVQVLTSGPFAHGKVGQVTIRIAPGERAGTVRVALTGVQPGAVVLTKQLSARARANLAAAIVPSSSGSGAVLEITATLSHIGPAHALVVQWVAL